MDVIRCQPTIGAEIRGVDLARGLTDDEFEQLRDALLDYKIVFFRDQRLDAERQLALGRRFGELEVNPFRPQGANRPALQVILNDRDNPVLSTDVWHADLTFREKPTKFTILNALEVPPAGGDTLWADMCAAYDGLDSATRERITGLTALHDFRNFRVLYAGSAEKQAELRRMEQAFPNPSHPVVVNHADTLARVLFVNRQFTVRIEGLDADDSAQLLEHLYAQASVPEYQFRLRWRPGTVAIWDNRACQHYAANDYYPARRHMERVAVAGDALPFFDPAAVPAREIPRLRRVHAFEDRQRD